MALFDTQDEKIADSKEQEQVLKGIQPRHQIAFKVFKGSRVLGIFGIIFAVMLIILQKYVHAFDMITSLKIYGYAIKMFLLAAAACFLVMSITKMLFLRRAPFDDWVFEIAEKRLGTDVIFYDSKHIYIQYDRSGKEVDKRDFVSEMSDKSIHYSYFYVKTFIDEGVILVECKKRAPIPDRASFTPNDDKYWNIIPLGLTIHPVRQKIAPIGWYINDQNINEELYETVPSTSMLICGGTGCFDGNTPIKMYDTLVR